MSTTARASTRAGMVNVATQYGIANPTYCRDVSPVRPTRLSGDLPFCYIDILAEDTLSTSGTLQRVLEPSFVFVMRPIENEDQVTLADAIVDSFTEHLKDWPSLATGPTLVWSRTRLTEESIELPTGEVYPVIRFTLLDVTEMTGRA